MGLVATLLARMHGSAFDALPPRRVPPHSGDHARACTGIGRMVRDYHSLGSRSSPFDPVDHPFVKAIGQWVAAVVQIVEQQDHRFLNDYCGLHLVAGGAVGDRLACLERQVSHLPCDGVRHTMSIPYVSYTV